MWSYRTQDWTFIVGVMVIKEIIFIWRQGRQHIKVLQILFLKIKENCAILDRSIPTRDGLVHSIPIGKVKDMTSDVLRALKAFFSEKNLWTLFVDSILTIFKKEKLHTLWISFYNIFHHWDWHFNNPFEFF